MIRKDEHKHTHTHSQHVKGKTCFFRYYAPLKYSHNNFGGLRKKTERFHLPAFVLFSPSCTSEHRKCFFSIGLYSLFFFFCCVVAYSKFVVHTKTKTIRSTNVQKQFQKYQSMLINDHSIEWFFIILITLFSCRFFPFIVYFSLCPFRLSRSLSLSLCRIVFLLVMNTTYYRCGMQKKLSESLLVSIKSTKSWCWCCFLE